MEELILALYMLGWEEDPDRHIDIFPNSKNYVHDKLSYWLVINFDVDDTNEIMHTSRGSFSEPLMSYERILEYITRNPPVK